MRLSQRWINKLAKLQETGMGYQIVDIYLKNGNILYNITVVNGEEIINIENTYFSENDIQDIKLHQ